MIVNKQKEIILINKCNCNVDKAELKNAILWYAKNPVIQRKTIYLHGKYPAVSIYKEKLHIHRLLMSYWLKRKLTIDEYVHHKDGDKLNATNVNLEIIRNSVHQSNHNKNKIISKEHKKKIAEANKKRKGTTYNRKYKISVEELKSFLKRGDSINKIAKHYGCDWTVIKQRIFENPELIKEVK